jgi:hypothetical protein
MNDEPIESSGRGGTVALALSILVNLVLLGGGYVLYKGKTDAETRAVNVQAEMAAQKIAQQQHVAELETNFADEMRQVNEEWTARLAEIETSHQRRIAGIYDQVNKIMYEGDETIKYIDTLETKLRGGQTLAREEIETLQMIGAGLGYLHEQYEKPIGEFRELEQFLSSKLDVPPLPPKEKNKFLARIFSKKFREEEKSYYQDVGRWEAFESARNEVTYAYGRAQQQMAQVKLNTDKYLGDLQNLMNAKELSAQELDDFFASSRKVLNIHQEIMKLQEDQTPPSTPPAIQP